MEVNNHLETKTIYNVIGQIRGAEEPDRYVLMGNHRDAWVFVCRTIMLCSWDAEEMGAVGSAEWVEENARFLQDRAVGYLNMDVAVNGNFTFNVDANPLLQDIAVSLTKDVCDPTVLHTCKSMYDVMLERDVTKHVNGSPVCNNLPFGSDYAAFYHFLGVSCADWSYIFGGMYDIRRTYPVYHSLYDTFYWMKTFVDPGFKTHLAVTKYAGIFLLKLADSKLLPFNTTTYGELLRSKLIILETNAALKSHNVSTVALSRAVKNFVRISREFERNKVKQGPEKLRALNDQMMQLEKAFIQTVETNDHKQLRHVIFGLNVRNLYGDLYFPRVHYALIKAQETGDCKLVEKEISLLTYAVNSAAKVLKPI